METQALTAGPPADTKGCPWGPSGAHRPRGAGTPPRGVRAGQRPGAPATAPVLRPRADRSASPSEAQSITAESTRRGGFSRPRGSGAGTGVILCLWESRPPAQNQPGVGRNHKIREPAWVQRGIRGGHGLPVSRSHEGARHQGVAETRVHRTAGAPIERAQPQAP